MRLAKWLRSGIVEKCIKDSLESTINEICINCPFGHQKETIYQSLNSILKCDKEFYEKSAAHAQILKWFEEKEHANFNKTRIQSNNHNGNTRSISPPPVKQYFSLSGAIVEYFYNYVEKELYMFLLENECIIPAKAVEAFVARQQPPINKDFRDADVLCMLNFIIDHINIFQSSAFHGYYKSNPLKLLKDYKEKVRHKVAHGVSTGNSGRWSDLSLQTVAHLSCHVVACLGGNYGELYAAKEKLEEELSRSKETTGMVDEIEFVLDVLEGVEETEKGQKKIIIKLALDKDELLMQLCRTIKQENKEVQVRKFIKFANVVLKIKLEEPCTTDSNREEGNRKRSRR